VQDLVLLDQTGVIGLYMDAEGSKGMTNTDGDNVKYDTREENNRLSAKKIKLI